MYLLTAVPLDISRPTCNTSYRNKSLDWSTHVLDIARNASRAYGALRRAAPFLSEAARLTVYKSIIRPQMEYASPVWSNCSEHALNALDTIERRCSKLFPSLAVGDSLSHRRKIADLAVYHSILHRNAPPIISDLAPPLAARPCNTRQATNLHPLAVQIPTSKTEHHKKSFMPGMARMFNALPTNIATIASQQQFKINCNAFLR